MPKKHQQKSLLTKPTSSASPILSLSRQTFSSNNEPTTERTVNELIRESRRGQGNESRQQVVHNSISLPPTLRAVLDMPTPPAPPPRQGMSGNPRLRRIPGPPPPRSGWIDSIHAPVGDVNHTIQATRSKTVIQLSNLPGVNFPTTGSLQHILFKSLAARWKWHAEYDYDYLAELPTNMKEIILSYIAIYNEDMESNPLRILFPNDTAYDELCEVRRLDLGNAIGSWSSMKSLEKDLYRTNRSTEDNSSSIESDIPETWDDIDDHQIEAPKIISNPKIGPRFMNLKHLSLAAMPNSPGRVASWQQLLGMTNKLRTLTSLSLAYWPQPTYTPNASIGRYKVTSGTGSAPSIVYGGTSFYTAFDNDWREAAGILRTLSRSSYCLKWLDLTGCGEWLPALIWGSADQSNVTTGPDWNGSWRELDHLILAVGWIPGKATFDADSSLTEAVVPKADNSTSPVSERNAQILSQISTLRLGRDHTVSSTEPELWDVEHERQLYHYKKENEKYNQLWTCAINVARELRQIRKGDNGKWIEIECGEKLESGVEI